jgi:hypothetical protein
MYPKFNLGLFVCASSASPHPSGFMRHRLADAPLAPSGSLIEANLRVSHRAMLLYL